MPAGQSLISDYFDRHERPRAMAIYISFYTISMIIGYLVGGQLVDAYGWRSTFIIIGVPAIAVAILAKFTIKEPRDVIGTDHLSPAPPLIATISSLWSQKSFRQILIIFCLGYFFNAGVSQWLPTFLIRSHDMTIASVGSWLAIGVWCFRYGGHLSGRTYRNPLCG